MGHQPGTIYNVQPERRWGSAAGLFSHLLPSFAGPSQAATCKLLTAPIPRLENEMHVPLTPLRCLTRAVDLYPGKIGVVSEGSRYSYAEFGDRSRRITGGFIAAGVIDGDRIGVLLPAVRIASQTVPLKAN